MVSFSILPPQTIAMHLATRLRARRLAADWSRKTLAERSGVPEVTIKRFENSGSIALESLIMLALALDAADEFSGLFPPPQPASIEELLAPPRQRGRR